MRSLKKIFWAGLISLVVLWLIYKAGEALYKFPGPLRNLLSLATQKHIPGLEFVAAFIIIMILGVIALYLSSLASSKISILNKIIKFSKTAHKFSQLLEKGELKSIIVKIGNAYYPGVTTGKIVKTDNREMIRAFLPNTPNITSGHVVFITKEEVIYTPELDKIILATLLTAGFFE